MNSTNRSSRFSWGICILILLFIFSPILSTQADAHPGAIYVIALVFPLFVLALSGGFIRLSSINLFAVLLLISALFSTLISDYTELNIDILKTLVFVVFFISTSSFVLSPKQLMFSFKSYLYLSIVISFLIILSFIYGYPHIEATLYQGRYSIGITGLFKNPNYLTSFYNVAFLVVCYILATVSLSIKRRVVLYMIIALLLVSSYFTGTRAALLVEVLVIMAIPLVLAKSGRLYVVIPIVLVLVSVIVYSWSTIIDLYELFIGTRDMMGDTSREDAWVYAIKYIKENLVFGCGHKSWNVICHGTGYLEYLHNIFLELVLDQGIIGLLLVFGLVVVGYNKTNKDDRFFLLMLLFVTAIPMFFQNGLYEVNFWRFIIINRLMMNVSVIYKGGISGFLKKSFCIKQK